MPEVNEHGPGFAANFYCIVFIVFPSSEMEQKTRLLKFGDALHKEQA